MQAHLLQAYAGLADELQLPMCAIGLPTRLAQKPSDRIVGTGEPDHGATKTVCDQRVDAGLQES